MANVGGGSSEDSGKSLEDAEAFYRLAESFESIEVFPCESAYAPALDLTRSFAKTCMLFLLHLSQLARASMMHGE